MAEVPRDISHNPEQFVMVRYIDDSQIPPKIMSSPVAALPVPGESGLLPTRSGLLEVLKSRISPSPADYALKFASGLMIDAKGYSVMFGNPPEPVELTKKQLQLVSLLATHPFSAFTRETILQSLWGLQTISRHTLYYR